MTGYSANQKLDTSGLNCPMPILKAKKAITSMQSGEILEVIATDPGAVRDFAAFARQTGHQLLESKEEMKKFYFVLKKK